MDISKIVSDSLEKSTKQVANREFNSLITDNQDMNELASQNAMLMNYVNILVATYHKELKKELSKHGIEI